MIHGREFNPSLWMTTSNEPQLEPLPGDVEVDVAVVGGGITGLTTALLLHQSGVRVAVLEAGDLAASTSGFTTGKFTSLHRLIYADLARRVGDQAAAQYAAANQEAIEQVARLTKALNIQCQFQRQSAYTYTCNPDRVGDIEEEYETAARIGLPVALDREVGLPFPVEAALRLDDQVQLHPRQYCLGLAGAIDGDSRVHTQTRVTDIVESNGRCEVITDRGTVRAERAIVATLVPFLSAGELDRRFNPSRSYLVAARVNGPPLEGMYISAEDPIRSLRSANGHLLVGGDAHAVGHDPDTKRHYEALEQFARERFDVLEFTHRWSAQDYVPPDRLPYIGQPGPDASDRILVATGFQKWGLTLGTAAAMLLRDLVLGDDNSWLSLFDARRKGYPEASQGDGHHQHGEFKQPSSPEDLAPGEGAVFGDDDDQVAVYRDEQGGLHKVSALCTHLGCPVSFNTAERSWDCHCHGSRFDVDGRLLQGPAVKDLDPA